MAHKHTGHRWARAQYPVMGLCEECGQAPARDRHHKDGDVFNNRRRNIQFVCRRCHMRLDGRLATMLHRNQTRIRRCALKPCAICRILYFPLRNSRCNKCETYWRRVGRERPRHLTQNQAIPDGRPCLNCGRPYKPLRRGKCGACVEYFKLHDIDRKYRWIP